MDYGSTDVTMKDGLPFEGKGENSWDCGEDALFGRGVSGHDIQKAIDHGIEACMENRRKYGTPSRLKEAKWTTPKEN